MAIKTIKVQQFDGIVDDVREGSYGVAAMAHWETNDRKQLIPLRDMETETAGASLAYLIQDFCYHTDSAGTSWLYGIGVASNGDAHATFYEKVTDVITGVWTASTTGDGTTGVGRMGTLCSYKTKLFCLRSAGSDSALVSYDPVTNTLNETVGTLTGQASSTCPRPFRHPKTDILYMAAGNSISILNNTSFSANVISLPTDLTITSLTDYGNYLAIAAVPNGTGKSYVFLWDMVSVDIQEVIEWGNGTLKFIENIEGYLVGLTVPVSAFTQNGYSSVVISTYSGGSPVKVWEALTDKNAANIGYLYKAKKDNILYFPLKIVKEGTTMWQIFTLSKDRNGRMIVRGSFLPNNDTVVTTINGFNVFGEYCWTAINGSAGLVTRTNDQAEYAATSYIETLKFNGGDASIQKQLQTVSVFYSPLPAAGTVVLKYRKDEETAWTQIFTDGTNSAVSHESINIESTGASLPTFKEIQFRIESTGGAELTGYEFKVEELTRL